MAEMNAAEFQRELSDAIETKKLVEGALTEGGRGHRHHHHRQTEVSAVGGCKHVKDKTQARFGDE